jgi:nucleotide-binding universal stress UspA family protein
MKILATFDGSSCSEVTIPQLEWLARMPDAEFTLLSIAHRPHETARARQLPKATAAGMGGQGSTPIVIAAQEPALVEDRGEAIDRTLAERSDYLEGIIARLPRGPRYNVEALIADDIAAAIIRYAMEHQPDVMVMGTHGETGIIHSIFGDTAEEVVRSGVAPVLLVHSDTGRHATSRC